MDDDNDGSQNHNYTSTPTGKTVRIDDVSAYVRGLNEGHGFDLVEKLLNLGCDPAAVEVYKLFLQGKHDARSLENAIRELSRDGQQFWICQVRVSSDGQAEEGSVSLPQQERDSVITAIEEGAKRVLVICEVYSAAAGSERGAFSRLVHAVRQGLVNTWVTSQLDRVTRNPSHAIEFVEALQASNTSLRSSTHHGPVNPYEALILMLQFIMAAFHVIAIKSGNARGWRKRIDEGRWPNPAHPLPGMEVDSRGRPMWTPLAKQAIGLLFDILDPETNGAWDTIEEALAVVEREYPAWWKTATDDAPPSIQRVKRLLGSTCCVDGRQKFEFKGEEREAHFAQLGGLVDQQTFEDVGRHVLLCENRATRVRGSPWARLFNELVFELDHPVGVLVAESGGVLQWSPDGTFLIVCTRCGPASAMREIEPHYDDLTLADGSTRKGFRVPVFECDGCQTSVRPMSIGALRLLLAGARRTVCVRCHSPDVTISAASVSPAAGIGSVVTATCRDCGQRFWFDADKATPAERYRWFLAELAATRRVKFRPEVNLSTFDPEESNA